MMTFLKRENKNVWSSMLGFNLQIEKRERRCKQERYEALNVVQKFVNGEEDKLIWRNILEKRKE